MAKRDSMWLDRALFVTPFCYRLCLNEKDFQAELKQMGIARNEWPDFVGNWHSDATTWLFENKSDYSVTAMVNLKNWEDKTGTQVAALLVHEAVHLWQKTRELYGEDEPSKELEAYSIQTISQRLMESFAEQTQSK